MDIANLQFKVSAESVPKAYQELSKLEQQSLRTEIAAKRMATSQSNADVAYKRAALSVQRLQIEQARLAQQQDRLEKSTKSVNNAFGMMTDYVKGLGAAYLGLKLINMIDQFTLLRGRVAQSTESIREANQAWDGLVASARQTGALEASVSIFQRLSLVRTEIKATNEEMLQFTDTVGKLGVASGASGDALKFGLTQLGQSLSSDIVRAEEFNSIMENIPAVGKAIADQLGITTGQMRNLVIDGELLSKDVFSAILNAADEANDKFSKMPMTIGRAFSTLLIDLQSVVGGINEASGASQGLIFAIQKAGQALGVLGNLVVGFANVFDGMFSAIVGGILEAVNTALTMITKLTNAGISAVNIFRTKDNKLSDVDFSLGDQGTLLGAGVDQAIGTATNKNGELDPFKKAFEGMGALYGLGGEEGKNAETVTREISKNYKDMATNAGDTNKALEKQQKLIDKTVESLKFRNEQITRSKEEQELYNQLNAANVEIDTRAGQEIKNLVDEYFALKEATEQVTRVTEGLADSFGSAFEGFITGTKDAKSALRDFINDVQKMIVQETITGPLKKLITGGDSGGGFGGILGSLVGGIGSFFGGGSSAGSNFAALDSAMMLGGFASGGSFQVGGQGGTDSQLVAFRASPDETVSIRRPDQQGQGGGAGNVYNIDARGASVEAVARLEQMIGNLDRNLEKRSLNAVNNTLKRDPTYGRRS